jgi:putative ABC transport system permease protein
MYSSIKHAILRLVKSPGFTLISLLTLALGIGINTTAYTILNRMLLQGLPFREPGRLVQVTRTSPQQQNLPQAPGDYFDEAEQNTAFEKMALYYVDTVASLALPGKAAQTSKTLPVNADFFSVMGVAPMLGRPFAADDEAHQASLVILTHAFWLKYFGGDPKVLGQTFRLDGKVVTIVGVMGPTLDDPLLFGSAVDLLKLDNPGVNRQLRDKSWYNVAARLKPGVSLSQAQAEMTAVALRLAHDFPKTNSDRGFKVAPYPTDSMGDLGRNIIWMIMDLALVVLLIACVNLANLQIVRTTGRSREFAIRLALGSSRSRLVGMLLWESVLLSLAGGAVGLLVAAWGNSFLAVFFQVDMPLDVRVLTFAFVVSAVTGAVFGTLPAWLASRSDVNSTLKQGSRGSTADRSRHRLRQSLIVVELALALTCLTGAGFFVRGIQRIMDHNQGWSTDHVLLGFFSMSHDRYGEEGDERSRLLGDRFRAEAVALPGVEQAGLSQGLPLFAGGAGNAFVVEGKPIPPKGKEPGGSADHVTPGYFAIYGMHIEQGRDFTEADRPGAPRVVIVSHSMAAKFWPGENPIGKRIGDPDPAKRNWSEVVGVVNDINGLADMSPLQSHFEYYTPWEQDSNRFIFFSLRTERDPRTLEDGIRKVLSKLDPDVAISILSSADAFTKSTLAGFGVVRRLLVEIAALGLLLSAVGIYGVIANLASERTQEIGIRMALGAQPRDVLWLFLRNGVRLALIGTGIGLLGSIALMSVLKKTMAIVPGDDPWVVAAVAVLLVGVTLFACWLPARRATAVNPIEALRSD